MFQNPPDSVIREIFSGSRTIAVVGCSPKEYRDSNMVARFLMQKGHLVTPVNPGHRRILERDCYRNLLSLPEPVEVVDVFRRSEYVPEIMDQAIQMGARIVWTQLGVYHEESAQKGLAAGLTVIMNRCPVIEYNRLGL